MTPLFAVTTFFNRVMDNGNRLVAAGVLASATIFAVVQFWQLRFSLVDLAPLGCIYLMSRSVHRRRVTRHT